MESIRVAVRVRPEEGDESNSALATKGNNLTLQQSKGERSETLSLTFDKIYGSTATQDEIFDDSKYLVDAAVDGYNSTIFAFGMTGSGKTHTIAGDKDSPGLVPRSIHHIFNELRKSNTNKNTVSMVFLSYIELYNNNLYDLLSKYHNDDSDSLRIHEHPTKGIIVTGSPTLRVPVSSADEALTLIAKGNNLRSTSATQLNERSSRSHTVITLEIVSQTTSIGIVDNATESKSSEGADASLTRVGRLNLVDLAGSERVKLSGATGQTLEEAKQINKALTVLGDVLNALSKQNENNNSNNNSNTALTTQSMLGTQQQSSAQSNFHIPYRNSKLTMLLKDSLGGNARTMMIATIRPLRTFISQSVVTLRYAARTKLIRCHPIRNVRSKESSEAKAIHEALDEVSRLKHALEQRNEEYSLLQSKLKELSQLEASRTTQTANNAESDAKRERERTQLVQKEREYAKRLEDIQWKSSQERLELQEKMKCLISNHETNIEKLQKENITLEDKLQQQLHTIHELSSDHSRILSEHRNMESTNESLQKQLVHKNAEISRLKLEVMQLQSKLEKMNDLSLQSSIFEKDKAQFIAAIEKINASRMKYKDKCELLQSEIETCKTELESKEQLLATQSNNMVNNETTTKLLEYEKSIDDLNARCNEYLVVIRQHEDKNTSLQTIIQHLQSQSKIVKSDFNKEKSSIFEVLKSFQDSMTEYSDRTQKVISAVSNSLEQEMKSHQFIATSPTVLDKYSLIENIENLNNLNNIISNNSQCGSPSIAELSDNNFDLENRVVQLQEARQRFLKLSGIDYSIDSSNWLTMETVLLELQNKCKEKDYRLVQLEGEYNFVLLENKDIKLKLDKLQALLKIQDKELERSRKKLESSRKEKSDTIKKSICLFKSHIEGNSIGETSSIFAKEYFSNLHAKDDIVDNQDEIIIAKKSISVESQDSVSS